MRVVLQEFLVVIGLDYERLHLTQSFNDHFRHVTQVGDESEVSRAGVKREPQRIDRVVRYGKRLDGDVANRKLGPGRKDSPVTMPLERGVASNSFCRQCVAINRYIKFAAENFKSTDVVSVLVGEQDTIELLRQDAALLQAQHQLPRAQPAIDKNLAVISCYQGAVSRAPAAEHGQAEHGSQDRPVALSCANGNNENDEAQMTKDEGMSKIRYGST